MIIYYLGPLRSEVAGSIVGVGKLGKNASIPILDLRITPDQKNHQRQRQDLKYLCH
jgi:hypothetical protein